jgi:hypothetical protein
MSTVNDLLVRVHRMADGGVNIQTSVINGVHGHYRVTVRWRCSYRDDRGWIDSAGHEHKAEGESLEEALTAALEQNAVWERRMLRALRERVH